MFVLVTPEDGIVWILYYIIITGYIIMAGVCYIYISYNCYYFYWAAEVKNGTFVLYLIMIYLIILQLLLFLFI